uniref:GPI transamidase component PIG-T n=1 Tax=Panagrolaimus superbus TaxID=310955 RepID=A0A914XXB5_9BILA
MRLYFVLFYLLGIVYAKEKYSEELYISTLPNHDLSSIFRFVTTASVSRPDYNFLYIPLTIRQLLGDKIEEFQLSMTTGFWRHNIWGVQPQDESPTGISLRVKFVNMSEEEVNKAWSLLVKQVNGIFCSSILEMDPSFTATPNFHGSTNDLKLYRYGHLSGEPLCTENIKPFIRLLPCKVTGFSSLIDLKDVFATTFHTLSVGAKRVLKNGIYDWRVELFAHFVKSHVQMVEKNILYPLRISLNSDLQCKIAERQVIIHNLPTAYSANLPDKSTETPAVLDITNMNPDEKKTFMVRLNRTVSQSVSKQHTPMFSFHIAHEKPDARGGILSTKIVNNLDNEYSANYYHIIPWQLHIELSSLDFTCVTTGQKSKGKIMEKSLEPSLIRGRPTAISLHLRLPPYSKCTLKLSFTNHLMTALSYPPDSNYGIFVPGPVLSIQLEEDIYRQFSNVYGSFKSNEEESKSVTNSKRAIQLYGEPLLVLLPVPDFSMPFNVICIVTTATGFLFGSTFNLAVKLFIPVITTNAKTATGWREKACF